MQRVRHAERRQDTRRKILIGAAVIRAGAGHLSLNEIATVLHHYIQTGGEPQLRAHVARHKDDERATLAQHAS